MLSGSADLEASTLNGGAPSIAAERTLFQQKTGDLQTAVKYAVSDVRRRKCNWCVGMCTVYLVVAFISLLQAAIVRSPIIFMKLAEDEVGDFDILVSANPRPAVAISGLSDGSEQYDYDAEWAQDTSDDADDAAARGAMAAPSFSASSLGNIFVNQTWLAEKLAPVPTVVGTAPRWIGLGRLLNPMDEEKNASVIILVTDTMREEAIGAGRAWTHAPLGYEETHVSSVLLRRIGVKANAGEQVVLRVDLLALFAQNAKGAFSALSQAGAASSGGAGTGGDRNITTTRSEEAEALAELLDSMLPGFSLDEYADVSLQTLIDLLVERFGITVNLFFDGAWAWLRDTAMPWLPPLDEIDRDEPLLDIVLEAGADLLVFERNLTVIDGVDGPDGKYPKALGNVAMLENTYLQQLLKQQIDEMLDAIESFLVPPENSFFRQLLDTYLNVSDSQLANALEEARWQVEQYRSFRLDDYALSSIIMYRDRLPAYVKDRDPLELDMIAFRNDIMDALGFTAPVTLTTPLSDTVRTLYFIRLFLDQIFNFTTIVLVGLSSLLIYSLMLVDVEAKTYEYGMLRAQGMRQHVLVELLLTQAMLFAVPGIALGLLTGWILFIPAAFAVHYFVYVPIDLSMATSAILTAVAVGLVLPVISNIAPIRRALGRTLRDALDVYHQTKSETTVRIIKLAKIGLSPWQVVISVLMVLMGFIVYYLMPYSFTFGYLSLFLFLLTLILLGMLVGFALVSQVLEPFLELVFLNLIVWGPDRRHLKGLVSKNLVAHSPRNRKTAIMFTVSLAFIIFVGTSMSLQGHSIQDNVELGVGADIVVWAFGSASALDEVPMRDYLETEMALRAAGDLDAKVEGYAFQTFTLNSLEYVWNTRLSNLAGYPDVRVRVAGVEGAFLNVSYTKFYRPTEEADGIVMTNVDGTSKADIINSLTINAGKMVLPIEREVGDENGRYVPQDITSHGLSYDEPTMDMDGDDSMGEEGDGGDDEDEDEDMDNSVQPAHLSNEEVYTDYVDVIVSESMRLAGSMDTSTPMYMQIDYRLTQTRTASLYLLAKAQGMAGKLPGEIGYSSYRQFAPNSLVGVSMEKFQWILNTIRNASTLDDELGARAGSDGRDGRGTGARRPPMSKLFIRMADDAVAEDRELVINALRNFIKDDITQVIDTVAVVATTQTAIDLLTGFFVVVTVIAVSLCFFVLWLSFTANIQENAWEFGVLRAVGLNKGQVVRVYVYEALALIFSSLLLGTLIGILQALTLTLQFNLFTELPFVFDFPVTLFTLVLVMSIGVAFGGSYFPARTFRKKEIASALKGL